MKVSEGFEIIFGNTSDVSVSILQFRFSRFRVARKNSKDKVNSAPQGLHELSEFCDVMLHHFAIDTRQRKVDKKNVSCLGEILH